MSCMTLSFQVHRATVSKFSIVLLDVYLLTGTIDHFNVKTTQGDNLMVSGSVGHVITETTSDIVSRVIFQRAFSEQSVLG